MTSRLASSRLIGITSWLLVGFLAAEEASILEGAVVSSFGVEPTMEDDLIDGGFKTIYFTSIDINPSGVEEANI